MNLEGTYAVTLNGKKVGTAALSRCGLYYEVACKCHADGDRMLHLVMEGNNFSENLGLLIPMSGALELKKRVPAKRIGEGDIVFFLQGRHAEMAEFVPVAPDAPLPCLHRLKDAVFAVRNGQAGLEFKPENNGEKVEI